MKPLPEAVQRAFPCAPERLPERPWWRRAAWRRCWRRDMTEFPSPYNEGLTVEYDAKNPLPHPGYRAGQVWAAEDGASLTIVQSERTGLYAGCGTWWANYEFTRAYPYLMADPSCPHLAPWSPAEEVKS